MLTSKERSNLKKIAANIEPITQIGKNGITDNLIKSLSDALDKREIIKIAVLLNAEDLPRSYGDELAAKLKAEHVATIGRKIILYRFSEKEGVKHIEYR